MRDQQATFETAWAKRPWETESRTDKDRAWFWWQAALSSTPEPHYVDPAKACGDRSTIEAKSQAPTESVREWAPGEREYVARALFGEGWKCCADLAPYVRGIVGELSAAMDLIATFDPDLVEHNRDLIEQTTGSPLPRFPTPLPQAAEKAAGWSPCSECPTPKFCRRHEIVSCQQTAAPEPTRATIADIDRAFTDACDEAGCAHDNEALLQAISDLKKKAAAEPTREEIAKAAFNLAEAVECSVDLDLHPLLKKRVDATKSALKSKPRGEPAREGGEGVTAVSRPKRPSPSAPDALTPVPGRLE